MQYLCKNFSKQGVSPVFFFWDGKTITATQNINALSHDAVREPIHKGHEFGIGGMAKSEDGTLGVYGLSFPALSPPHVIITKHARKEEVVFSRKITEPGNYVNIGTLGVVRFGTFKWCDNSRAVLCSNDSRMEDAFKKGILG